MGPLPRKRTIYVSYLREECFAHSSFERGNILVLKEIFAQASTIFQKKNVSARFRQSFLDNSTDLKKDGDKIKALPISELAVQIASL